MSIKTNTTSNFPSGIIPVTTWRITEVCPLAGYKLKVRFVDGTEGIIHMKNLITGTTAGIFSLLREKKIFNRVFLRHGAVTWPNNIDLAPDAMYKEIKKHGEWTII